MTNTHEKVRRILADTFAELGEPHSADIAAETWALIAPIVEADAIQAARLAYDRGRERRYHDENGTPISIPMAEVFRGGRRAATREIVEALLDQIGSDEQDVADAVAESAADFIESRFLSHPDNPEGNA